MAVFAVILATFGNLLESCYKRHTYKLVQGVLVRLVQPSSILSICPKIFTTVFTARCCAQRVLRKIRPSVCPSHDGGILWKRLNVSKLFKPTGSYTTLAFAVSTIMTVFPLDPPPLTVASNSRINDKTQLDLLWKKQETVTKLSNGRPTIFSTTLSDDLPRFQRHAIVGLSFAEIKNSDQTAQVRSQSGVEINQSPRSAESLATR